MYCRTQLGPLGSGKKRRRWPRPDASVRRHPDKGGVRQNGTDPATSVHSQESRQQSGEYHQYRIIYNSSESLIFKCFYQHTEK